MAGSVISLGTVTAGRTRPEIQQLLGYFLNPLPLRVDGSGDPTFREFLRRIRDGVLGALAHQNLPFQHRMAHLARGKDLSRNPLFQIMVSLEPSMPRRRGGWNLTQFDVTSGASKLDPYVDMDEHTDCVIGPITYNPDLFGRDTIERLVGDWESLLEAAAATPERRLSQLPPMRGVTGVTRASPADRTRRRGRRP